jgi:Zn-dependent peptidase ImmA (M78 family)
MKITELLIEGRESKETFVEMFKKFLPLAMEVLEIDRLPKIGFESEIESGNQPSFGMYSNEDKTLYVAILNRHPIDILRTVAHELVHYRQDIRNELNDESGATGSSEENQANEIAGVVMRHFNKRYPEFLRSQPI